MAQGGRVIVSGLVPYMTAASLENRLVIVIKNMKPVKLRGVISRGMLLCAEREGKVELLEPPPNSHPELVLNPKKKVWDRIAPHLTTDEHGIAKYRGETPHLFNGIIR
ncbi:hypothetical protein BDF22DRAFT_693251 [Syncephalis plumigaleata]|nr:hypothetical protein BDF22DRAFT_693251 [Syncephalis plumigaleata]